MPTSNLALWPTILHLIWTQKPRRILDVGPGRGKGGLLIREYVGDPDQLDAVELEGSYVNEIVRAVYDEVYSGDVCAMSDEQLAAYDMVVMVEVIEHLEKADGLALLDRIPGAVIVCTPAEFFENPAHLPESEKHRSLWSAADFGDRLAEDCSGLGAVLVRLSTREGRDVGALQA